MKTGLRAAVGVLAMSTLLIASCMNDGDDIPDPWEQLEKDIVLIDNYLEEHNIQNVIEHESGIRYVIHEDVDGISPTIDSCVTANYAGKLLATGTEFDSGTGISFPLGGVIDGWKIGIPLLNEGDSATLYIPSGYAYGYYGYPPEIPSNANLIFHVAIKNVGSKYSASGKTGSCN